MIIQAKIILIVAIITFSLWFILELQRASRNYKKYKRQQCKNHEWTTVEVPVNNEVTSYITCKKCRYIASIDMYEEG